ncbi:arp2/3 complex subunit [Pseudogymnoascus australis]
MSIIQSHTSASLTDHWRTIDIDALDPESSRNFPIATLAAPPSGPRALDAGSVRGLLRGGDAEGALRGAVGSGVDKEAQLQIVIEVLQSIKAADMTPLLRSVYASEGGPDVLDSLMKYFAWKGLKINAVDRYAGMAAPTQRQGESSGAAMSVLLSWHEKVVE